MKVSIDINGNKATILLNGHLDNACAEYLDKQISGIFELDEPQVTIDCTELSYIGSSELRTFFAIQKYVTTHQGSLTLFNMQSSIFDVFDMTGFSTIFNIQNRQTNV